MQCISIASSIEDNPAIGSGQERDQAEETLPSQETAELAIVPPHNISIAENLMMTPKPQRISLKKPQVVTDLRRSERVKHITKGFKSKTCFDKHCLACSVETPEVSKKIIKSLGETFCNIDPKDLSDEALSKRKKASTTIGASKTTSKQNDEAKSKKKP